VALPNFQVSEILRINCITSLVPRYTSTSFYLHLISVIYIWNSSLSFLLLPHFVFVIFMYLFLARSSISAFRESQRSGWINPILSVNIPNVREHSSAKMHDSASWQFSNTPHHLFHVRVVHDIVLASMCGICDQFAELARWHAEFVVPQPSSCNRMFRLNVIHNLVRSRNFVAYRIFVSCSSASETLPILLSNLLMVA